MLSASNSGNWEFGGIVGSVRVEQSLAVSSPSLRLLSNDSMYRAMTILSSSRVANWWRCGQSTFSVWEKLSTDFGTSARSHWLLASLSFRVMV